MSEKKQGTAYDMRLRMQNRYDDGLEHKHNKNHIPFRRHFKTHPVQLMDNPKPEDGSDTSTGLIREIKLKRVRKRVFSGGIH
jgi:hypothetical protein